MEGTNTDFENARAQIANKGVEILEEGLTQRTSGNLSIRIGDKVAISPSGVPYHEITPGDVPVVDIDGNQVLGDLAPSSETPMHLETYRQRDDTDAIIHTHSPFATTFASLGKAIAPAHYLIAFAGKQVNVAEYARNGTPELAEKAVGEMGENNAVLLRNHGVLSVGSSIDAAHNVASRVEYCARIYFQALLLGEPELVSNDELDSLIDYFQD